MLHRFSLFVFFLSVVAFCGPSFADDVPLDSVMHLFVQNPDTDTSKKLDFDETSAKAKIVANYRDSLEKERFYAMYYRNTIEDLLNKGEIERLKTVVEEAELFDRNASTFHVFYANDILVIKYFLKDYDFLAQVDYIKDLLNSSIHADMRSALYRTLKREIETGKIEENLREVPNESDRVFVYIILNSLFENKKGVSQLIEKYKYQLTDEKQLYFLVTRFWQKEDFDTKNYAAFSWGAAIIKPVGSLADKVGWMPGMYIGIDFIRNDFLYEWFMDINGCQNKEPDSLQFYDMRWDFNFGYTFIKNKNVFFYGYATVGFGMNAFNIRGKSVGDKANDDMPYQFYPAFGAGAIVDLFFTDKGRIHNGLRFRTGIRSIFSGDVLKASGVRLYASIEWTFREYSKKQVDFDYSFREKGVK
ncbi:hypothetical protein SAMN05720758_0876 [Fibrobacter sp. UWB11]|nr:hypothetical protein SAMN05720758_0876 [Fibrobacter sp. UWB11]